MGARLFGILIALALSPFIVSQLGLAVFGFWALVSAFSQYASLLDFGVGTALTRYVAGLDAVGDDDGLERKLRAGFVASLGFAASILLLVAVLVWILPPSLTHGWPTGWQVAFLGVGANLACVSVASAFQAIPRGFSRWDLYNGPIIAFQVTYSVLTVATLLGGAGLAGLGASIALAGIVLVLSARAVASVLWDGTWISRTVRLDDLRELLRYGANLQVSALMMIVNAQADKPILLLFGGSLKFVGYYELASRVAFQLRALPVTALGPLTVRAASDTAGFCLAAMRSFYLRALRLVTRMGVAPLFALYGACYPLSLAWLGMGYTTTGAILVLLGTGYAVNLLTGAGTSVANGCGRPDLERNYCLLCLATNVVLSVLLGFTVGPWGVIAGTAAGLTISSLWFLRSVDRWLELRTNSSGGPLRGSALFLSFSVLWGAATVASTELLPVDTRLESFLLGASSVTGYAIVCLCVLAEARTVRRSISGRLRTSGA